MKKNDNIEDLFKESFENFEAEVSPSVWSNVQTAIKGAGLGFLIKTLINKLGTNTVVAIVSSAATIVSTVLIMQWTGNSDKKTVVATKKDSAGQTEQTIVSDQNSQPVITETVKENTVNNNTNSNSVPTNNNLNNNTKITDNQINEAVKNMNRKQIAFISASAVAGPVPMIVNFENMGNGKINRWDFGDGKSEKNNNNPVHVYSEVGIYTVYLYSKNIDGVSAIDTATIEVYGNSSVNPQQAVFSPNGDGTDDYFIINPIDVASMQVIILDSDGKTVIKSKNLDFRWDGKDTKGKDAKEGKYLYMIKAVGKDGKKFNKQGIINLTR